jgi:hypothetical protein
MIWGYTEEVNFDSGVRKYLKVENPCTRSLDLYIYIFFLVRPIPLFYIVCIY